MLPWPRQSRDDVPGNAWWCRQAVRSGHQAMLRVPTGANWEFDGFSLLQETRLLASAGTPVPLTSKAFDTLVDLLNNSRSHRHEGRTARGRLARCHH